MVTLLKKSLSNHSSVPITGEANACPSLNPCLEKWLSRSGLQRVAALASIVCTEAHSRTFELTSHKLHLQLSAPLITSSNSLPWLTRVTLQWFMCSNPLWCPSKRQLRRWQMQQGLFSIQVVCRSEEHLFSSNRWCSNRWCNNLWCSSQWCNSQWCSSQWCNNNLWWANPWWDSSNKWWVNQWWGSSPWCNNLWCNSSNLSSMLGHHKVKCPCRCSQASSNSSFSSNDLLPSKTTSESS